MSLSFFQKSFSHFFIFSLYLKPFVTQSEALNSDRRHVHVNYVYTISYLILSVRESIQAGFPPDFHMSAGLLFLADHLAQ